MGNSVCRSDSSVGDLEARIAQLERAVSKLESRHTPNDDTIARGDMQSPRSTRDARLKPSSIACCTDTDVRRQFLRDKWVPFLRKLRQHTLHTQTRSFADVDVNERLPTQREVLQLSEENMQLTAEWYGEGNGNVSAVYEWLMELTDTAQVSAYRFDQVATTRSHDGYVCIIDGRIRQQLYKSSKKSKVERRPSLSMTKSGELPKHYGESPIDNSVAPNVFTPLQARMLVAGGNVKSMLVAKLATRQRQYLAAASNAKMTLEELATNRVMLKKLGINVENLSWRSLLRRNGVVITSFAHLSPEEHERINGYLSKEFQMHMKAKEHNASVLNDFREFVTEHPGRLFGGDRKLHKALLFLGMWSNDLAVVKRSLMESYTMQRYIPLPWRRMAELVTVDENKQITVLREVGSTEYSRFRKNAFPYAESHGLGISSGGTVEGNARHDEPVYNLGVAMPVDGGAKLGNWFCNDFEKVLFECNVLNPAGGINHMLPGEECHEASQNPKFDSSIGETQHTQLSRTIVADWPVLGREAHPVYVPELRGFLDVCHIGFEVDSFFVKLRTQFPYSLPVVQLFTGLRRMLIEEYGRNVDFYFVAIAEGQRKCGWFTVVMAPIAQLEPTDQSDRFLNPDTGRNGGDYGLPIRCINSSSGKGAWDVYDDTDQQVAARGYEVMQLVYDFSRKVGAFRLVRDYLLEHFGYVCSMQSEPSPHFASPPHSTYTHKHASVFSPLMSQTHLLDRLDVDEVVP